MRFLNKNIYYSSNTNYGNCSMQAQISRAQGAAALCRKTKVEENLITSSQYICDEIDAYDIHGPIALLLGNLAFTIVIIPIIQHS